MTDLKKTKKTETTEINTTTCLEALPTLIELPKYISLKKLNGENGSNRAEGVCHIDGKTDFEAVQCWLDEYKDKPATHIVFIKKKPNDCYCGVFISNKKHYLVLIVRILKVILIF